MPVADPADVKDYAIDWKYASAASRAAAGAGDGTLAAGETITVSTWAVPAGITQTTPAPSQADGKTTIWITGGTDGVDYDLINHVTTSAGRQYDRTLTIKVRNR